jgi:hypothetical protein
MFIQRHLLVPALVVGLLPAALSGCGGAGKPQGSPATSRPATSAKPTVPTTSTQLQVRLFSVLNGANSMHVKATNIWPRFKVTVNAGLLKSGQMTGFIDDDGLPMSMIYVGGKMYVKNTAALAAYYHQAGCAPYCNTYSIYPRHSTASLVRSVGWKWTWNTLMQLADFASTPVRTTFHGQPALQSKASGFQRGAYVIVTATPDPVLLEAVDPHHFKMTFSAWNSVPAPVAPPKSKMAVP